MPKISALPAAGTLTGSEAVLGVQAGADVQIPPSRFASFINAFTQVGTGAVTRTVQTKLQETVSIQDFGGDPTGTTDSTTAFNNALASLSGKGGDIYFPPGKYLINSSVTFSLPNSLFSVTIRGAGADNTILYWPSGNGLTLDVVSIYNSFHIKDLTFSTGGAASGAGLIINGSINGVLAQNTIENVTFRGDDFGTAKYWTFGVDISVTNDVNFINVNILGKNGNTGTGIVIAGNSSYYAFNYYFTNCNINALNVGIEISSYTQGVLVCNCALGANIGIYAPSGLSGTLTDLAVFGSQFAGGSGISLNTNFYQYMIVGNTFAVTTSNNGINIPTNAGGSITGNTFNPYQSSNIGTGINLGTTVTTFPTTISGNTFYDLSEGIVLGSGAAYVSIQGNMITSTTTPLVNSATAATNWIVNNPGYNPVGTSASANVGASVWTYTAGPSPETHYLNQSATFTASVHKNGVFIGEFPNASTITVVHLGPNESYTVTWATTAPTYVKDVH